jgi:hypothetical protein
MQKSGSGFCLFVWTKVRRIGTWTASYWPGRYRSPRPASLLPPTQPQRRLPHCRSRDRESAFPPKSWWTRCRRCTDTELGLRAKKWTL